LLGYYSNMEKYKEEIINLEKESEKLDVEINFLIENKKKLM
jgi:hypothetical protein